MNIKKTANLLINFTIKRLAEILGIIIFIAGFSLFLALSTYSPEDPNFIFPDNREIKNILGFRGSFISDFFFSVNRFNFLLVFIYLNDNRYQYFQIKRIFLIY